MRVQAIDQNIFPRYWERPKYSIARGQRLFLDCARNIYVPGR